VSLQPRTQAQVGLIPARSRLKRRREVFGFAEFRGDGHAGQDGQYADQSDAEGGLEFDFSWAPAPELLYPQYFANSDDDDSDFSYPSEADDGAADGDGAGAAGVPAERHAQATASTDDASFASPDDSDLEAFFLASHGAVPSTELAYQKPLPVRNRPRPARR